MLKHALRVATLGFSLLVSSSVLSSSFEPGSYTVQKLEYKKNLEGAPAEAFVFVPKSKDNSPIDAVDLVYLNHGFLVQNQFYTKIATHLASHGYLVVVPQMYNRAPVPFFKPSFDQEAELGIKVVNWILDNSERLYNMDILTVSLSGHSRGGTVMWRMIDGINAPIKGLIGIDPVDGTGNDAITKNTLASIPTLNIGALQSGSCAPADRNFEYFVKASAPSLKHWLVSAENFGHMDMLDSSCGLVCSACKKGTGTREDFIQAISGSMVAFIAGLSTDNAEKRQEMEDFFKVSSGFQFKVY